MLYEVITGIYEKGKPVLCGAGQALHHEGAKSPEVGNVLGQLRSLIGLQGHGQVMEAVIVEQMAKSFQADAPLANMGVAIIV